MPPATKTPCILLFDILACLGGSAAAADTRPNIVLFLADDLGYGELGCYGNAAAITPHLDRFASQGLKLTDCHSSSSVRSPSRSSLLTGRTPFRSGVFNSPKQPQPSDHGYAWWLATQISAAPSHAFPENFIRNGTPVGKADDYSAPFIVKEAVTWLEQKRDAAKPFFLTVWAHEPHYPIASAERYEKLHAGITDPEERTYRANVTQLDDAFAKPELDNLPLTSQNRKTSQAVSRNGSPRCSTACGPIPRKWNVKAPTGGAPRAGTAARRRGKLQPQAPEGVKALAAPQKKAKRHRQLQSVRGRDKTANAINNDRKSILTLRIRQELGGDHVGKSAARHGIAAARRSTTRKSITRLSESLSAIHQLREVFFGQVLLAGPTNAQGIDQAQGLIQLRIHPRCGRC